MVDILTYALCRGNSGSSSAVIGLSAYEIAKKNGFEGTEEEWLNSLKGQTPYIGDNGNWFIGSFDTGVAAGGQATAQGKLKFGKYEYDGSEDVIVDIYEGEYV